jgi:hypothetical protein
MFGICAWFVQGKAQLAALKAGAREKIFEEIWNERPRPAVRVDVASENAQQNSAQSRPDSFTHAVRAVPVM